MMEQSDRCIRCDGMMVEVYADLLSPSETGEDVIGRRCVNCGEYVDRQVLLNRSMGEQTTHPRPRLLGRRSMPRCARPVTVPRRTVAA